MGTNGSEKKISCFDRVPYQQQCDKKILASDSLPLPINQGLQVDRCAFGEGRLVGRKPARAMLDVVQKRPKAYPCFNWCSCSMWLVAITFFFFFLRTIFPRLAEFCCILDSKIQAPDRLRQEALLPSQLDSYFLSQDPTGPCQLHTHWKRGKRFRRGIIANPSRDMQVSFHNVFFPIGFSFFVCLLPPGLFTTIFRRSHFAE